MKKFCFCSTLLLFSHLSGSPLENLPKTFFVEDQNGHSTLYDVKTDQQMLGIASQEVYRLSSSFQFKNTSDELLATAHSQFYCWGVVAHIRNPYNKKTGWIEEQSFQWFTRPVCRIYDENNYLVGIAQRNFWGNRLEIRNPKDANHIYAVIERPWHRFSNDLWQVHVLDQDPFVNHTIDASILVLLATYDSNHNQESKVIQYAQDDEYIFMNEDGFIQIGAHVQPEPAIRFGVEVTEDQQKKITDLFGELKSFADEFLDLFSSSKDQLQKDESVIEELLENLFIPEPLESEVYTPSQENISYKELSLRRVHAEINRWIQTLEIGVSLLKNTNLDFSLRESLFHILNEFVTEITL